jgi:hypothetical protein
MATRVTVKTAQEYAQALIPHLEHEAYRCDQPWERLMGKGCRTCGVEAVISIPDFQANGDLEAFEKEMKPFVKKKGKK